MHLLVIPNHKAKCTVRKFKKNEGFLPSTCSCVTSMSGSVANFSCQQATHRNSIHPSASYTFRLRWIPLRMSDSGVKAEFENLRIFT
jgi:hypothetical protein